MGKKKKKTASNVLCENRKARFNYHLLEKFEAGIVLTGAEIKSIRNGGMSLAESYVRVDNGELFLVGAHIAPYAHMDQKDYNPTRKRKLLMNKYEIEKIRGKVDQKGMTIAAVKVYLKRGFAKLEIALAKGKDAPDKRQTIKEREAKKEAERAMKR